MKGTKPRLDEYNTKLDQLMRELGEAVIDKANPAVISALENGIQSLFDSYSDVTKEANNPARSRGTGYDITQKAAYLVNIERRAIVQAEMDQIIKSHANDPPPIVQHCNGVKCPRCWKYNGSTDNHQGLCDHCVRSLLGAKADDFIHNRTTGQTEDDFRARFLRLQQQIMESLESQRNKYHVWA